MIYKKILFYLLMQKANDSCRRAYCLLYFTCLWRIICTYTGKQSKLGERDRRSVIMCSCMSGGPGEATLPGPKHFHLHSYAILSIKHFHLDGGMFLTLNKASTSCCIPTNMSNFGRTPSKDSLHISHEQK